MSFPNPPPSTTFEQKSPTCTATKSPPSHKAATSHSASGRSGWQHGATSTSPSWKSAAYTSTWSISRPRKPPSLTLSTRRADCCSTSPARPWTATVTASRSSDSTTTATGASKSHRRSTSYAHPPRTTTRSRNPTRGPSTSPSSWARHTSPQRDSTRPWVSTTQTATRTRTSETRWQPWKRQGRPTCKTSRPN